MKTFVPSRKFKAQLVKSGERHWRSVRVSRVNRSPEVSKRVRSEEKFRCKRQQRERERLRVRSGE